MSSFDHFTWNHFANESYLCIDDTYYVDDIIDWIDQHPELENVIASWGKGSPMDTEVRDQIKRLNDHLKSRGIKSDLYSLPPFGRGVSYENLSIELEPFILNS